MVFLHLNPEVLLLSSTVKVWQFEPVELLYKLSTYLNYVYISRLRFESCVSSWEGKERDSSCTLRFPAFENTVINYLLTWEDLWHQLGNWTRFQFFV